VSGSAKAGEINAGAAIASAAEASNFDDIVIAIIASKLIVTVKWESFANQDRAMNQFPKML
jgi:hypothetical protein